MRTYSIKAMRRAALSVWLAAFIGALPGSVAASGGGSDAQEATGSEHGGKAVVVPYKTRPAPSHRVSLHDDRVFFLKKLEETDGGYVLHTMEDESIEVEDAEIAEIMEFEKN